METRNHNINFKDKPKHLVTTYRAISRLPTLGIKDKLIFPISQTRKHTKLLIHLKKKKHFTSVFLDNIYTNVPLKGQSKS